MKTDQTKTPVQLRDVALKAGVSLSTVSRVVSKSATVSPATTEKVMRLVKEMGYTPSAHAQALRAGPRNVLGLLLSPELIGIGDELITATITSGLIRAAAQEGYWIIPEPLSPDVFERHTRPAIVEQGRVNGLFVLGTVGAEALSEIVNWGLPVCLLGDSGTYKRSLPAVDVDYAAGSSEVVQYLGALGHRRIAFVHGDLAYRANQGKMKGYVDSLREFGILQDPSLICQVSHEQQNFAGGYQATRQLLTSGHPPTAIYYVNDWYAVGGLAAILAQGLKVPGDISIVGCDDSFIARQCSPALSSVAYDYLALTRSALDMLIRSLKGRQLREPQSLTRPRLIRRESCAPCKDRGGSGS